ncbi:OLC1v1019866C1 [Oldenlandia corymbosa var. corymbosa]|uniref:Magnesium transporter n=1 Tax=Oldenlandia corymbosa var. corymbosa TaxID=529605 RepID=A0AAV1EEY5_OLDCO|nr:OLC1v1019866C1 [Oldenlandia corymbosa var. corymbosa]
MGKEGSGCIVPVDDGSSGGGSLTKKTPGPRSWIRLDASGQEMNMEADKYVIINRVQIHARDFRIIDPFLSYPSKILSRERAIILNLEHIKAIITAEEVLVLNPLDENVIAFLEALRKRLPLQNCGESLPQQDIEIEEEDENPFELRALEIALEAICCHLDDHSAELENAVYEALDMLTLKITHRNMDKLRKLKSQMTRLTSRVQKVRDELHHLLDDDHVLANFYLSRKLVGRSSQLTGSGVANLSIHPHKTNSKTSRASRGSTSAGDLDIQGLEMLLEAYFIQVDGTVKKLAALREYVDSTEDYLNLQLDNRRNQLYQLDMFLSAGILSLSIYAGLTGFFGMNFNYTWAMDGYGYTFKWVVIVSGIITLVVFLSTIGYARQKGLFGAWTNS